MRKIVFSVLAAVFALPLFAMTGEVQLSVAEAYDRPQVSLSQREMKRRKNEEPSSLYDRAHDMIYHWGKEGIKETRPTIAIVINGDENFVVEDRVKDVIYKELRKKFPKNYFALMKGTDINTRLLQYAEDVYYDDRETAVTEDTTYDIKSTQKGFDVSMGRSKTDTDFNTSGTESGNYSGTDSYNNNTNGTWANNNSGTWTNYNDDDTVNSYGTTGNTSTASSSADSNGSRDYNGNHNDVFNSRTVGDIWSRNIRGGIHFGKRSDTVHKQNVTKPSKVDVDGMPVGVQPRGLSDMRREDYVRVGRDCGYDYVLVISFSNGQSQVYKQDYVLFTTNSIQKNVWMRVRFLDMATGNYLYRNNIAASGKTHNGYVNGRVFERSVAKAMEEAMNDVEVVGGY